MIPNSDVLNWIIVPVSRAVLFVGEEMKISGTLVKSLVNLSGQEMYFRIAREKLILANHTKAIQSIDRLIKEAPFLSKAAGELKQNDYHVINSHSLIGMWSAVEVAVEDTIVLILSKESSALKLLTNCGIKITKFGPGPVIYEDARKLFKRIERKFREKLKVGESYIKLFDLFGINVSCNRNVLAKMDEINSVRNCLMHRGGVIDDRAAKGVAALQPFIGKQMPITQARYHEYFDAISAFLVALCGGVTASSYIKTAPQE